MLLVRHTCDGGSISDPYSTFLIILDHCNLPSTAGPVIISWIKPREGVIVTVQIVISKSAYLIQMRCMGLSMKLL